MITGHNYIGFQRSGNGSKTFKTFNPVRHEDNAWLMYEASDDDIERAVELATNAAPLLTKLPGIQKAKFLNTIADEIMALGDILIHTYCLESGLPEGRAIGERSRTIGQLQRFAELVTEGSWVDAVIDTADPERSPLPKPDVRRLNIALGPVVVFGASNFPLAFSTAGGDTASAFAAGCPVIIKSHPMHAGTGELIAYAIVSAARKTHMPEGVFSNLNSSDTYVGQKLVAHPQIKAVGFTGSLKGGRALLDLAAKRIEPIPVFAEMGSINPVIMLPQALKERGNSLAKTYASSITLGTGQFCTNPGLILGIKGEDLTNFIETLGSELNELQPSVMLHPNTQSAYEVNKTKALNTPEVTTVAHFTTGVPKNHAQQALATVNGSDFLINPQLHHEIFGPYSLVVQCQDAEELEIILLNLEGQLTGTIVGQPEELSAYPSIIEALQHRVGRIIYNGVPTGVEVCAAMVHGGPYPATTDPRFTAVGTGAIKRWVRPFSYQDWPDHLLPPELKNTNPLGISRMVNGNPSNSSI